MPLALCLPVFARSLAGACRTLDIKVMPDLSDMECLEAEATLAVSFGKILHLPASTAVADVLAEAPASKLPLKQNWLLTGTDRRLLQETSGAARPPTEAKIAPVNSLTDPTANLIASGAAAAAGMPGLRCTGISICI